MGTPLSLSQARLRCASRYNTALGRSSPANYQHLTINDSLQMIRVAILGASGYSALELMKLCCAIRKSRSPRSRRDKPSRRSIGEVHPSLAGRLDLDARKSLGRRDRQTGRLRVLLLAARRERRRPSPSSCRRKEGHRSECRLSAQRPGRVRRSGTASNTPIQADLGDAVYGLPEIYREMIAAPRWSPIPAAIRRPQSSPWRRCCEPAPSRREASSSTARAA